MAAPTTAYHTEKDKRYLAGANDTITETRELLVAKFLQNTTPQTGDNWGDGYINSGDLPPTAANWETAKAKIMDIFKIDGISVYANGDGRWGFIGYCHSRSSGNGLYHKTERFSGCKVPNSAYPDAEFLNDGSLNVMPYCRIIQNDSNQVWWANCYSVKFEVRSAFYAQTTKIGFEYKINNGSWIADELTQVIPEKTKQTIEWRSRNSQASQGDTIYLRAIAYNEEGKRTDTEIYSHALAENIVQKIALKIANINDTTGVSTTIYMTSGDSALISSLNTSSQSLGIDGFTSDLMNTEIANGYYKGLDPANADRVFTYAGEFTKYDTPTGMDEESMPIGMPRLYKMFAFAYIDDVSATGMVTDSTSYDIAIALSIGASSVGANVEISPDGAGAGRYADIWMRRTNANNSSLNEDIWLDTIYMEPGNAIQTYFLASLTKGVVTDYDKFTILEIIP